MRFQRKLEEETNKPFLDLSLHETMYKLIVENNQKGVEQLRKDFKVPDRRYDTLSWLNTILNFQVYVSIYYYSDFITHLFHLIFSSIMFKLLSVIFVYEYLVTQYIISLGLI